MLVARLGVYSLLALVGGYVLAFAYGAPSPNVSGPMLLLSLLFIAACSTVAFLGYILWLAVQREPSPILRIRSDLSPRLALKLIPMVLAFLFLGAFGTYKSLITHIQPFYLDGFLSDLDRWMLGTDAWRITHAVIGSSGTAFIELAYRLWFAELSLALMYFSIVAKGELQRKFFLTFFVMWALLGFVGATLLSSAGPCFLWLIHHPYADRYADLFPLLQSAPVALAGQHMLAEGYQHGAAGAFLGISAMPSMHVAFAALVVLATRHVHKLAFVAALVFYVLILVGSVHLGYHYLSDGIVGTLGVVGLWNAEGLRFARSPSEARSTALVGPRRSVVR